MSGWRIFGGGEKKPKIRHTDKDALHNAPAASPASTTDILNVATATTAAATPATDKVEKETVGKEVGGAEEEEDDTYDVLATIEKASLENRKMLLTLMKRSKTLEERLDEYDKLFSRLTEFLDIQQMNDVRQHNRLLRLGMPVPFRSTQTDRVGMDRVPAHGADRWQSVAQGPMIHRHAIFHNGNGQPMCNVGMHRDI